MDAHDELIGLAEEYWDVYLAAHPTLASLLGDRRFDDRIEDLSAEGEERLRSTWTGLLGRVNGVDATALDSRDRVTASLLRSELARDVEALTVRLTELASDQMGGVHADLLTVAPEVDAPTPESARALLERHRQIPTLLDQAAERFRHGLAAGRVPARLVVTRSLSQLDGYLASDVADDPFVTLAGPEGWDGEDAWRQELAAVARDTIRPAFQRYREVIAGELAPVARPDDRCGLSWLGDDGAALYDTLVRAHTTLDDLDPEIIHQLGLAELDRLAGEYAEVGGRLLGTGDQEEIFARLRAGGDLRYQHGDEIMADARRCLTDAQAAVGGWFGRLPRSGCDIKPVPDFLAADMPGAYYMQPAADGSRPGTYYVNLSEPTDRNRFETAAVAFHEAIPGHHLQLTIATELDELPRFQRLTQGNTAFAEGWGLYAERLADEMGLYRDDLDRLGMLSGDSMRSCRLVVDTGLHVLGWSRQQAIDFMVARSPAPLSDVEVEVDRYVAIPGQALGYKVGQLEIERLRRRAEQAAGSGFDVRSFHDATLGSGTVSLPVLRQLLDA